MKNLFLASLTLAGLCLAGMTLRAGDCGAGCATPACGSAGCGSAGCASEGCGSCAPAACAPAPHMACVYVDQPCVKYKPEWHEREVVVPVTKLVQHEVTDHKTVTVDIPVVTEQVKYRTVCTQVPREVCKEVTCTRMVETCEVDPCTGCSHKVCKPECSTKQVKSTVMENVSHQEAYTEKVCTHRQEQQTVEIKRMVCELVPSTEKRTENHCTMVPYASTERVQTCQMVTPFPVTLTPPCSSCAHSSCAAPAASCGCAH